MPLNHFQLVQEAAGAHFPDKDHAYPYPAHYGDPQQEYQAGHESAVLFDLSDREQVELKGTDCQKFLHNFCTNDIKSLPVDQGCEAFVTNVQSRILGYITVFNQGDSLWLDLAPGQSPALNEHLDRYIIMEDVEQIVRSPEFGCLYLTGPEAGHILSKLDIAALAVNQQQRVTDSEAELTVRRVDWFGQPGYLCCLLHEKIVAFWQQLIEAGAKPAGQEAFEALRIESCFPLSGIDLTDENLAQEAGRTSQAISFKKGCYLGQEPIARIDALGHVNQELRIIALEGDELPAPGTPVMATVKDNQKEVGKITSAAKSYGKYPVVALAIIRKEAYEPGTKVEVVVEEQAVEGTVLCSMEQPSILSDCPVPGAVYSPTVAIMSQKTVNSSMSRETLQLRLLKTNLAFFALLLLGTTWQLWTPQTRFPQIPLFEWVSALPAGIDWLTLTIMLTTAGCLLLFSVVPLCLRRPAPEPGVNGQWICGLLFLVAYAVSVLFDQHRLQPWTYQFALGLLLLTSLTPSRAIRMLRLFVISIYVYSALSKCDASFVQTLGRQLAEGLFSSIGISTAFWSPKTLGWIAATFPMGELLVAAGLFFRRTRKPALVAAIGMHVCLMLAIGPWGLNHYQGVLIWNVYFIIQDLLLFMGNPTLDRPRAVKDDAQLQAERLAPARVPGIERVPLLLVWLAILAPLFEPTGYFDHWPAWGLYASRHDRVVLLIDEQARAELPASLQPFVDPPQPLSTWCRVRVERWSLAELGAPLYPQARFQLGVAIGVGRMLEQQAPTEERTPRIRIRFEGAADRWTGKRKVSEYTGLKEIEAQRDRFWLNTLPRPVAHAD